MTARDSTPFFALERLEKLYARTEAWRSQANCRGKTKLFYPKVGGTRQAQAAQAICRGCAVREQCLDYALENREMFGVWGGLTEPERRRLRGQLDRKRRQLGAA